MTNVHYINKFSGLKKATEKVLKNFYDSRYPLVVKLHFGEPRNKTALWPKDISPVIKQLAGNGLKIMMVDTPVAYQSRRGSVAGYLEAARKRGWPDLGEVKISDRYLNYQVRDMTVEVCCRLAEAKNVLVVSHVKGHACTGFGGAIKNLGMGGVSKKTKTLEHSLCKPKFTAECRGCGNCARLCPAGAIKMIKGKAKIDLRKCWGCSICEIECPYACLSPQKATLDDLLAQAAVAVARTLPKRTYYLNLIKRVTKSCDCEVNSGDKVNKNLGALFSPDPVAIDQATLDLINQTAGKNVFQMVNHKDPYLQVDSAARYIRRKKDYRLIPL